MRETFIVLLSVHDRVNPRKECEHMENSTFQLDNVTSWNVKKKICEELETTENDSSIEVWALTDFMDRVNDEEFNPDEYFMSYVHAVYDDGE